MTTDLTERTGNRPPGLLRSLLVCAALVGAIIVGLLGMHVLNLHGTPASHVVAGVSMSAAAEETVHGAPPAHEPGALPGVEAGDCAGCGGGHAEAAGLACVLALLLVLLLLAPPGILSVSRSGTSSAPVLRRLIERIAPQAPSRLVLCISRT